MHFIVPLNGTAGDVHPYLGIAQLLAKRGHRITTIIHSLYAPLAHRMGFEVVDLNDLEEYNAVYTRPELSDPWKGGAMGMDLFYRTVMRPQYHAIMERYVPGKTAVFGSNVAFGARIAREKHGVPYATAVHSPYCIRSLAQPPAQPIPNFPAWLPRPVKGLIMYMVDRIAIDPMLTPKVNQFRAELDLPPIKRILNGWDHSPDLIIGLFPEWYCEPRPSDWPKHVYTTEFPMFDARLGEEMLDDELRAFLDAGDPPIVFTPGSSVNNGQAFFTAAAEACRRLGRRGMLLSKFRECLPPELPPGVRHFSYVPFSLLLPRAAALVAHGGPGTIAQALAAGIPQVSMPMNYDQPDNARRTERLGVGKVIPPRRFNADRLTQALAGLLDNPEVARRCADFRDRMKAVKEPNAKVADLLEQYAEFGHVK
jgi:UDP:flavonoid glycosyltransferase YjiC (YdhE family)